jgi:uncharacterized RDD family membrane protein YckC
MRVLSRSTPDRSARLPRSRLSGYHALDLEEVAVADTQRVPKYVGFWKRLLASLIDTVIIIVLLLLLALPLYGREYMQLSREGKTLLFDALTRWVAPAVAAILFWRYRGATPGKMLFSMKIVDADTLGAPSTGKLIGRYFAYLVSMIPLCLGFLWIAFDKRKQGWHDKLAGTVVIDVEDEG